MTFVKITKESLKNLEEFQQNLLKYNLTTRPNKMTIHKMKNFKRTIWEILIKVQFLRNKTKSLQKMNNASTILNKKIIK